MNTEPCLFPLKTGNIFTWINAVFSFVWFSISLFVWRCFLLELFLSTSFQSAHKLQLKAARWSFSICFLPLSLPVSMASITRKGILRIFFHFRLWILLQILQKFHSLYGFVFVSCSIDKIPWKNQLTVTWKYLALSLSPVRWKDLTVFRLTYWTSRGVA